MVHGDDQGLVLPPKLAPYQVVIVPIFKTDEEKALVLDAARKLKAELVKADIRVTLDEREGNSPGWKFNDWEMRGVPVRVELGPKDVAKQSAVLARRDRPGREGKISAPLADLPQTIERLLAEVQQAMHDKRCLPQSQHPRRQDLRRLEKSPLKPVLPFSLVRQFRMRSQDQRRDPRQPCAAYRSTSQGGTGVCVYCGKPAPERAIFARAY